MTNYSREVNRPLVQTGKCHISHSFLEAAISHTNSLTEDTISQTQDTLLKDRHQISRVNSNSLRDRDRSDRI